MQEIKINKQKASNIENIESQTLTNNIKRNISIIVENKTSLMITFAISSFFSLLLVLLFKWNYNFIIFWYVFFLAIYIIFSDNFKSSYKLISVIKVSSLFILSLLFSYLIFSENGNLYNYIKADIISQIPKKSDSLKITNVVDKKDVIWVKIYLTHKKNDTVEKLDKSVWIEQIKIDELIELLNKYKPPIIVPKKVIPKKQTPIIEDLFVGGWA